MSYVSKQRQNFYFIVYVEALKIILVNALKNVTISHTFFQIFYFSNLYCDLIYTAVCNAAMHVIHHHLSPSRA